MVPFMVADCVILISMRYIDKGMKAEQKLNELEEKQAEQNRAMKKNEKFAQKAHNTTNSNTPHAKPRTSSTVVRRVAAVVATTRTTVVSRRRIRKAITILAATARAR